MHMQVGRPFANALRALEGQWDGVVSAAVLERKQSPDFPRFAAISCTAVK